MALRDWLYYKRQGLKARLGLKTPRYNTDFRAPLDTVKPSGGIANLLLRHKGRPVTKWVDYLDKYDRHFSPYRTKPVTMLEIGVFNGGSLELWREYFGPKATIFGIDINPACAERVNPPNQVRIGSQADLSFLLSVVAEMGAPDIILDDGSHIGWHQAASFTALFPLLKDGGVYVIEDLHTAYWAGQWEGGYRRRGTAIEMVKQMIDDMHAWFHERGETFVSKQAVTGIHIYDSIVFIEKGKKARPAWVETE